MLNHILNDLTWSLYGIECSSHEEATQVYHFMREAIQDRHIYIKKVIGFAIHGDNGNQLHGGTYIARHMNMGDSYPELAVVYSDKVFLTAENSLNLLLRIGSNTMRDLATTSMQNFEVLYANDYAGRALTQSATVCLMLHYGAGYRTMAENSAVLEPEFFPCNTDFCLKPFVRVLPFAPNDITSTRVQLRFYNGMTSEQFRDILTTWLIHSRSNNLNSEELKWMQHFTL